MTPPIHSGFRLTGRFRIISLRPRPAHIPLEVWLSMRRRGAIDHMVIRQSPVYSNLIMLGADTGLNIVLQHLFGTPAFPLELTRASIGTGNTAPASSDTDLVAPVYETIVRSIAEIQTLNTLYTEWFVSNDELPDGEYKEFALWCDTQLFARALIGPPTHTKATNEDTLFTYQIFASNT